MRRADYGASSRQFYTDTVEAIIGSLASNSSFAIDLKQRNAWQVLLESLKTSVVGLADAHVFIEFTIPRMGRRVDAVVLNAGCIFVLEYKVGSESFYAADIDQVYGYALDLKHFHEPSHSLPIIPILIATAAASASYRFVVSHDRVCEPILSNGENLGELIEKASIAFAGTKIDYSEWVNGRYKPTPTIIEAAQALYRNHRVDDITRNEAGAENLSATAAYVFQVINDAKQKREKAICFITGVPGSGKTLAGLNIATIRTRTSEDDHAVFLSGNGPLVKVLRAALVKDQKSQAFANGSVLDRTTAGYRSVTQFIQNIHHFRDANLDASEPPIEKVVIFDEAQRAWNRKKTSQFMRQDRAVPNFDKSEPEFLLSVMDRHKDWCAVICLVGHGQEINTGEAGIAEWITALRDHFPAWHIHVSDRLVANPATFGVEQLPARLVARSELHLSTSIRSFRSETVSSFVSAIIDGNPDGARTISEGMGQFEFRITRDLKAAREWLRSHRRGTERSGLLAFSNGMRLKPEGIFVKSSIEPENWFLADRGDVRSSDYLEDIATEFDVQGLELDWACVCMDANLRVSPDKMLIPYSFRGTRWQFINAPDRKQYALNAHRVLLTRARQGVIIYIPNGDVRDATRNPHWYNMMYNYLTACGVVPL